MHCCWRYYVMERGQHLRPRNVFSRSSRQVVNSNRTRRRVMSKYVVLTSLAVVVALCAQASGAGSWVGATNNNWSVGANWDDGLVPAPGTDVTFASTSSVSTLTLVDSN